MGWFMLRLSVRCVPFDPKYPTITARSDAISRSTFRFHDCRYALLKPWSTVCGARPAGWASVMALSKRIEPVTVSGIARGGLPLVLVTKLTSGWSARIAYAARTDVLPE